MKLFHHSFSSFNLVSTWCFKLKPQLNCFSAHRLFIIVSPYFSFVSNARQKMKMLLLWDDGLDFSVEFRWRQLPHFVSVVVGRLWERSCKSAEVLQVEIRAKGFSVCRAQTWTQQDIRGAPHASSCWWVCLHLSPFFSEVLNIEANKWRWWGSGSFNLQLMGFFCCFCCKCSTETTQWITEDDDDSESCLSREAPALPLSSTIFFLCNRVMKDALNASALMMSHRLLQWKVTCVKSASRCGSPLKEYFTWSFPYVDFPSG